MISMMKPKAQTEHEEGMLEYLEDIIGSNRFKEPIEILAKRIDKIHEVRSEKVNYLIPTFHVVVNRDVGLRRDVSRIVLIHSVGWAV